MTSPTVERQLTLVIYVGGFPVRLPVTYTQEHCEILNYVLDKLKLSLVRTSLHQYTFSQKDLKVLELLKVSVPKQIRLSFSKSRVLAVDAIRIENCFETDAFFL